MCGILCVFNKRNTINIDEIVNMRDEMIHRGPDDSGLVVEYNNKLALAYRRLAILDLSMAGHQPMKSKTDNYIIYNGEVYNYKELRNEYFEKESFKSSTDTEVVLNMIDNFGVEAFKHFNGMWGLLYYDINKQSLIISRDRYGIKPLYYYENENVFIVASEIKAILKSSYYRKKANEELIKDFLNNGYEEVSEESFFKGIKRFPKSCYMEYSLLDYKKSIHKYYRLEDSLHEVSEDFNTNVVMFNHLICDSIYKRMRSDVPIGVCLSGGLDSSTIYSVASILSDSEIMSFSAKFDEPDCDESYFYNKVIEKYKGQNKELLVDMSSVSGMIRRLVYTVEEPNQAKGIIPQHLIMKLASKNVKVLLDGQGGDEILGGYDPYFYYYAADIYTKSPDAFEKELSAIRNIKGDEMIDIIGRAVKSIPANKKKFRGSYLGEKMIREFWDYMLPPLLKYEDRNSMAYSIEVRLPFLDYRLVDFMFSLDERYKISNGWSKYILREGMKGILPEEVRLRKDKKGYPTPLKRILDYNNELYKYIPVGVNDEWVMWKHITLGVWREVFEV